MAAAKFGRSTKLWNQRNKEKQKHVKTKEQKERTSNRYITHNGYFQ